MRRRETEQSGFTLFEVLVALALLGAIFVILFSGVRFVTNASTIVDKRLDYTDQVLSSHRLLRRLFERAYPLPWSSGAEIRFAFEGKEKSLSFAALLPDYPSIAGPYMVRLYQSKFRGEDALWLALTPYRREPNEGSKPKTIEDIVLIPGPVKLTFGYYGRMEGSAEARWHNAWVANDRLPSLIRLSVHGDAKSNAWPNFVLPVAIDMDVGCLFEPGQVPEICRMSEEEANALRQDSPQEAENAEQGTSEDEKPDENAPKTSQ